MALRSPLPMWAKILIGLVAGVVTGFLAGDWAHYLKPVGDLFITLIRMVVLPVIFVSLVCGVTAMHDLKKMGRVAGKTMVLYMLTMALAGALSMTVASYLGIGSGLGYTVPAVAQTAEVPSFIDTIMAIVPANPFKAFADGAILPVIVFAIFFGLSINLAGKDGKVVADFFRSLNHVVFQLVNIALSFAPYGVFALMAYVTADNGFAILSGLAALVGTIYFSCLVMLTVVYAVLLLVFGLNPWHFIRKMLPVQLFAFSTTSSNATLPLNLKAAETQLGVHNSIASFVLPLGATVNMNGLATYLGAVAIFAANAYGIELTLVQKVTVVLTTTLAAIGAAGVPGTGLVVMSLVLSSVGLPLEVIAAIAAVDRIIDMINTPTNVSGDTLAAVLVAKSEGELELDVYNGDIELAEAEVV
ncbi:dicarboxylate/amino acid:cation symporter [Craterilacuibacter sp. RT1T]|uniref:dicarboxylate/amino acid:cation symporter n=1 Tax=Craterilacuibacter sp. RT1T TaxID=2942211 RepID=UPI0020C0CBD0|nr:dicarboxylate/amino acid:cation symporter [Craterilacuibacter sp. RT1T]MCL6263843.1 dicarboxylate/amino acid:cation symporter [Craterilacuibacter sp. RT1T]